MKQTKKNRIRSKITEKTALCLLLAVILSTNIGPITFATSGTASSNGTTIETAVRTVDTDRATGTDYYIVSSKLPTWNDPNFTLGHGPSLKPNAISGQDTTQRVSVRLNIFWKEPSSSGATITFTIPHGADYFQLGTDSSTAQYVKSATIATRVVAGEGKPRLVTLTLQGNPPIGQTFVIFYSFGYYPYAFNFHGDTGDLTPHLNIGGTEIVSGTPLTVSTAAEAIMYPGLEYTSTLYKISQTDAGFDANINYNTQPRSTQLAKIGVNYSMNPIVQAKLPDSYAIVSGYSAANRLDTTRRNPNSTAYINGATMKTASITITLPIEAVLAPISEQSPYFSRFAISTDALGRTVLTSSSWGNGTGSLNTAGATVSNGDAGTGSNSIVMTSYYTTAYRPEGPTFKVSYNAAPANGTTYDYDVKLTGTWYSGAPFEFDKLVPHLYSPNPITANVELRARLTATTLPGIPQGNLWTHRTNVNDGYLIYTTNGMESLALGDWASFSYQIENDYMGTPASEAPLKNMSIDMPVDGDLWDFNDMWISRAVSLNSGVLVNQFIGDFFDKLTITYSDGGSKVVNFSDKTYFDQNAKVNGGNSDTIIVYPALNFATWAAPVAGAYVTNFNVTLKVPLEYQDAFSLGFKAQLRLIKHSGVAVQPGVDTVVVTMNAKATPDIVGAVDITNTSTYSFTPSAHGVIAGITQLPIYATQDDRPLGDLYTTLIRQGPAASYPPGGATIKMVDLVKPNVARVSYNAYIVNPAANIVVPNKLVLDTSNVTVYIGRGTADIGVGAVNSYHQIENNTSSPLSLRQLSASDYIFEEVPNTLANNAGYKVYKVTYTGAGSATDENTGILKDLDDWCMRVDYNIIIPETTPIQSNLTLRTFWTEDGLKSGGFKNWRGWNYAVTDIYDLDGDGATSGDTLECATSTFDIVLPQTLESKNDSAGDEDTAGSWKMDGSTTLLDANLSHVRYTGKIRVSLNNGLSAVATGDLYFKMPVGDFIPTLTGLTLTTTDLKSADPSTATTVIPITELWYTTDGLSSTDPTSLTYKLWYAESASSTVSASLEYASSEIEPFVDFPAILDEPVWVKIPNIIIPGFNSLRLLEDYDIPKLAEHGDTVRSESFAVLYSDAAGSYKSATNYAGLIVSKPAYVINYYKESINAANLLGSVIYGDELDALPGSPEYVTTGDAITIAPGTLEGQLDWQYYKLPSVGYKHGVQQGAVPYSIQEALQDTNIINVLYAPEAYTITYVDTYKTSGTVPVDTKGNAPSGSNSYYTNSKVTILGKGDMARIHYTFKGWASTQSLANAGTVQFAVGTTFDITPANISLYADIANNINLYAVWGINDIFTFTYDGNGNNVGTTAPIDTMGNAPSGNSYYTDSIVTVLNQGSLVKDNWTFKGWNMDKTEADKGIVQFVAGDTFDITLDNIANYAVDNKVTLYAVWDENDIFTVTYNGNGNTSGTAPVVTEGSTPGKDSYYTGTQVTVLDQGTLVKDNWTFMGWNTNKIAADAGDVEYPVDAKFNIATNTTLYAVWKENAIFTVTYDGNGNTGGTAPVVTEGNTPSKDSYYTGTQVTVLDQGTLVKDNWTFKGWNTNKIAADAGDVEYPVDATFNIAANTTLYAVWDENDIFTVTYDGNGNTSGTAPIDTVGSAPSGNNNYYIGNEVTVLDKGDLAKTNYTFIGWNTNKTAADAGTVEYPVDAAFKITGNTVLYAVWDENDIFTVTYYGNGSDDNTAPVDTNGNAPSGSNSYYTGTEVTILDTSDMVKTNYHLIGWASTEELANNGTVEYELNSKINITGSIALYAVWEENENFTVSYDGNGNTGGSAPIEAMGNSSKLNSYYTDSLVTVQDQGSLVKDNWTFIGWNTDKTAADKGIVEYSAGATFNIAEDTTLYAVWDENDIFTVTYYGNGSDNNTAPVDTNGNAPIGSNSYYTGTEVTILDTSGMVRTNYHLIGWASTQALANNGTVEYDLNSKISITGSIALYAVWEENENFTVSYDGNGNTGGSAPIEVMGNSSKWNSYYTDSIVTVQDQGTLVKDNWTFIGWNTDKDAADEGIVEYPAGATFNITEDTTLYAVWDENDIFTITYDGNGNTEGTAPVDTVGNTPGGNNNYYIGSEVTVLDKGDLAKTNYTFIGWASSKELADAGIADCSLIGENPESLKFVITEDTIFYAVWSANDTYIVTYDPGEYGSFLPQSTGNLRTGDPTPTPPIPLGASGWAFVGWSAVPSETVTGTVTYVAYWAMDGYIISYDPGTYGTFAKQVSDVLNVGDENPAPPADTPGKSGWTFSGWILDTSEITSNSFIYVAQWTQDEYTITYNPGTHGAFTEQVSDVLHYGDTAPKPPAAPGKVGWTLIGWNTDKTAADEGIVKYTVDAAFEITGNTVLYAVWKENNIFTITYDGNGNTEGSAPVDTKGNTPGGNNNYYIGTEVTVLDKGDLAKTDYTFIGWASSKELADAGTADYSLIGENPESLTFVITEDTIFYAVWSSTDAYIVTYKPGDHGSFSPQSTGNLNIGDPTPTSPVPLGESIWAYVSWSAVPNLWAFVGWSSVPSEIVTGNVIYIAFWAKGGYTITYDPGLYGTFPKQVSGILYAGDENPAPPADTPCKSGWKFSGWILDTSMSSYNSFIYVAQWTKDEELPKTGEQNNMAIYPELIIIIVSVSVLVALLVLVFQKYVSKNTSS